MISYDHVHIICTSEACNMCRLDGRRLFVPGILYVRYNTAVYAWRTTAVYIRSGGVRNNQDNARYGMRTINSSTGTTCSLKVLGIKYA